jgi:hypothetical protein
MKAAQSLRLFTILGAAFIGSACIAQAAGPDSTPQIIVITATGETPRSAQPSPTLERTLGLDPAASVTAAKVTLTAGQDLSCVKGPHWVLFEWVARINEGETVTLLARASADWPDYYYARKSDGTECWAFGGSSTIEGDPSALPEREAPPLPTATYVIENRTYAWISDFFLRGKDETDWGPDRIGAGTGPLYGETFSLTITAGFYDVLIKDNHSGIHYQKEDIAIGPEPSSRHVVLDSRVDFFWDNDTAHTICRIRAEASDAGDIFEVHKPADGSVAPGARVWMNALAGYYRFYFHRCGDDTVVKDFLGVLVPGYEGIAPA